MICCVLVFITNFLACSTFAEEPRWTNSDLDWQLDSAGALFPTINSASVASHSNSVSDEEVRTLMSSIDSFAVGYVLQCNRSKLRSEYPAIRSKNIAVGHYSFLKVRVTYSGGRKSIEYPDLLAHFNAVKSSNDWSFTFPFGIVSEAEATNLVQQNLDSVRLFSDVAASKKFGKDALKVNYTSMFPDLAVSSELESSLLSMLKKNPSDILEMLSEKDLWLATHLALSKAYFPDRYQVLASIHGFKVNVNGLVLRIVGKTVSPLHEFGERETMESFRGYWAITAVYRTD